MNTPNKEPPPLFRHQQELVLDREAGIATRAYWTREVPDRHAHRVDHVSELRAIKRADPSRRNSEGREGAKRTVTGDPCELFA